MITYRNTLRFAGLALIGLSAPLQAQVHYDDSGSPWTQRADSGPDAEVPGWFYNLGITGLRAQLVADEPKALLVKYVFPDSPASQHVTVGDLIVGAGGQLFRNEHRNGYGMKVFGADGPVAELAEVLEGCQGAEGQGKLALTLRRGNETREVVLDVGQKYGTYAATYPDKCAKSDRVLAELLKYLVEHQAADGSFGDPVHSTFAPLALLASGEPKYLPAVERCVRYHCRETSARDKRIFDLINWNYMGAAIVLSEYYLATKQEWLLPELQEVQDFLASGQYLHMSQINPKSKKSHPDTYPKGPADSHGGWGHNPGFEGYGPIAMLTGQGALAYSLMHRCGIKVDRVRHDAAYEFLQKATGPNGYVWYKDEIGGGADDWADMGRTGAAGIANFLSPYPDPAYRERARLHSKVIGQHPQSFPDTHGSPVMGMAYTALAANIDPANFRKLMDANRWWFTLAQCTDGSFYYQPNRDNAGYGPDARMSASAVVAFIFTIPKHSLVITGKAQPGVGTASAPPANGLAPEITDLSPKSVSWAQEAKLPDLEKAFISAAPADRKDGIPVGKLENNEAILTFAAEIAAGKHGEVDSLLLANQGKLVFEPYYRRGRINYPHFQMSITKSYTAMAIGRAIQLGYLTMADLDKAVVSFLKEIDQSKVVPGATAITLAEAMNMKSGIRLEEGKAKELVKQPTALKGQGQIRAYLEHSAPIPPMPRAFKYQEADPSITMQVLEAVAPGGARAI